MTTMQKSRPEERPSVLTTTVKEVQGYMTATTTRKHKTTRYYDIFAENQKEADMVEDMAKNIVYWAEKQEYYAASHLDMLARHAEGYWIGLATSLTMFLGHYAESSLTQYSTEREIVICINACGLKCPSVVREWAREVDLRVRSMRPIVRRWPK